MPPDDVEFERWIRAAQERIFVLRLHMLRFQKRGLAAAVEDSVHAVDQGSDEGENLRKVTFNMKRRKDFVLSVETISLLIRHESRAFHVRMLKPVISHLGIKAIRRRKYSVARNKLTIVTQ